MIIIHLELEEKEYQLHVNVFNEMLKEGKNIKDITTDSEPNKYMLRLAFAHANDIYDFGLRIGLVN